MRADDANTARTRAARWRGAVAVAVIATCAGAWLAACGGAQSKSRTSAGASPDAGDPMMGMDQRASRDEISDLHVQITSQLAEMGLFTDDPGAYQGTPPPLPMTGALDSCGVAPTGEQCADVCTLADSICASASRICELADQLAGDAWAAERCDDGKVSCARAHLRCCGC